MDRYDPYIEEYDSEDEDELYDYDGQQYEVDGPPEFYTMDPREHEFLIYRPEEIRYLMEQHNQQYNSNGGHILNGNFNGDVHVHAAPPDDKTAVEGFLRRNSATLIAGTVVTGGTVYGYKIYKDNSGVKTSAQNATPQGSKPQPKAAEAIQKITSTPGNKAGADVIELIPLKAVKRQEVAKQ